MTKTEIQTLNRRVRAVKLLIEDLELSAEALRAYTSNLEMKYGREQGELRLDNTTTKIKFPRRRGYKPIQS